MTQTMFAKHYSRYYDLFNSEKPYRKEINFIYKWAGKPQWILDIGCGTCSYWKYYPKSVDILGVDRSLDMAAQADNDVAISDIRTFNHSGKFQCVTALFDVINYIPSHDWWWRLRLVTGGSFIFDIWDKEKVDAQGFKTNLKMKNRISRTITPINYDGKIVDLKIEVTDGLLKITENHRMYLYSHEDIVGFCGDAFEIAEVKKTKSWQTWYRIVKK